MSRVERSAPEFTENAVREDNAYRPFTLSEHRGRDRVVRHRIVNSRPIGRDIDARLRVVDALSPAG